jgi:hypothetical protein
MAKGKKPTPHRVKVTNFRLEDDTLTDLDAIAAHYTAEVGIKVNRTGAVRIAARNEHRRIKGEPKK